MTPGRREALTCHWLQKGDRVTPLPGGPSSCGPGQRVIERPGTPGNRFRDRCANIDCARSSFSPLEAKEKDTVDFVLGVFLLGFGSSQSTAWMCITGEGPPPQGASVTWMRKPISASPVLQSCSSSHRKAETHVCCRRRCLVSLTPPLPVPQLLLRPQGPRCCWRGFRGAVCQSDRHLLSLRQIPKHSDAGTRSLD